CKQIGTAFQMYLQDYDEKVLPRYAACPSTGPAITPFDPTLWTHNIQPYVKNKQIFLCPSASNTHYTEQWLDNPNSTSDDTHWGRGWLSIGYNQTISGWYYPVDACGQMILPTLAQVVAPAKNVMFADSVPGDKNLGYRGYLFGNTGLNVPY